MLQVYAVGIVCVLSVYYSATCGSKAYGSSGIVFLEDRILSQIGIAGRSRAPLSLLPSGRQKNEKEEVKKEERTKEGQKKIQPRAVPAHPLLPPSHCSPPGGLWGEGEGEASLGRHGSP